jgi:DNA-binding XRE family transcriptional regulator
MSDPGDVLALRAELGGRLKAARVTAGCSQAMLARKTGYARGTVSAVESGMRAARTFWERCDHALGTGTALRNAYDQSVRQRAAAADWRAAQARSANGSLAPAALPAGGGLGAATAAEAVAAYRDLGWRPALAGGRVALVCGMGVEALEVPRAAGVVAVRWWLYTGGVPDAIRRLPALPGPGDALVAVDAGDRFLFLVQAGACPWAGPDLAAARPAPQIPGVVVRWHAAGSTIPVPPSPGGGGPQVAWACPPPARPRLADPVVLLDLLARAAELADDQRGLLRLAGGICVVPSPGAHDAR